MGLTDIETKDPEREIDGDLRHNEDTKAGRISEGGFKIAGVGRSHLGVERAVEIRRAAGKLQLSLIKDAETAFSG